jgi:CheY-like chemotaxis protein
MALSANAMTDQIENAARAGFNDYVTKPMFCCCSGLRRSRRSMRGRPGSRRPIIIFPNSLCFTCKDIRDWEQKNHYPQIPIMALSANAMTDQIENAAIETCPGRVLNLICHCICRKSHDWNLWIMVLLLPVTDVFAGIVAILDGPGQVSMTMSPNRSSTMNWGR